MKRLGFYVLAAAAVVAPAAWSQQTGSPSTGSSTQPDTTMQSGSTTHSGSTAATSATHASSPHVLMTLPDIKWGAAPPALPKGAQLAVLSGDPSQSGNYTVRLQMPAGYRIPPHWHPTDENVTVISGTLSVGMGEKFEESAGKDLGAGSYAVMPAEQRHFAWSKDGATVQIHGQGPFAITYVNPADDPSRMASK